MGKAVNGRREEMGLENTQVKEDIAYQGWLIHLFHQEVTKYPTLTLLDARKSTNCAPFTPNKGECTYQIIPYSLLTNNYTTNGIHFNTTTTLTSLSVIVPSEVWAITRLGDGTMDSPTADVASSTKTLDSIVSKTLGNLQNQRVMLQREVLLKTRPHDWPHPYPLPLLLPRELDGSRGGYGLFHN